MDQSTVETVEQAASTIAPVVAAASGNPTAVLIANALPSVIQMLQTIQQLHSQGVLTPEQVASIWATVSGGVQAAHEKWLAAGQS